MIIWGQIYPRFTSIFTVFLTLLYIERPPNIWCFIKGRYYHVRRRPANQKQTKHDVTSCDILSVSFYLAWKTGPAKFQCCIIILLDLFYWQDLAILAVVNEKKDRGRVINTSIPQTNNLLLVYQSSKLKPLRASNQRLDWNKAANLHNNLLSISWIDFTLHGINWAPNLSSFAMKIVLKIIYCNLSAFKMCGFC